MSDDDRFCEEWRDAFLTLSAFMFGMAVIGVWWFGLACLPLSLLGAALFPSDPKSEGKPDE